MSLSGSSREHVKSFERRLSFSAEHETGSVGVKNLVSPAEIPTGSFAWMGGREGVKIGVFKVQKGYTKGFLRCKTVFFRNIWRTSGVLESLVWHSKGWLQPEAK